MAGLTPFGGGALGGGAGAIIGGAVVRLFLDDSQFNAALAKSEVQTKGASAQMAGGFSRFATVAKTSLLVAGVAALKFAATSVQAAATQGEALNKATQVFGDATDTVVEFADTTATSALISKTSALQAASAFGLLADAAGFTEEESAKFSTTLVQLAGDLSSFNDIDPTEALRKLQSGLAGQARPLREVGVFLSEAQVKTEAYASGIAEQGAELTDGQKIQARYNLILEQTVKAQGDVARTADSLPNQMRAFKASVEDLQAEIGKQLLPSMVGLLKSSRELIDAGTPLIQLFFTAVNAAAGALADTLTEVAHTLDTAVSLIPGLKSASDDAEGGISALDAAGKSWQATLTQMIGPTIGFENAAGAAALSATQLASGLTGTTEAERSYNTVAEEGVRILEDQKAAIDALAGGLLGIVSGLSTLKADQQTLNQLRKEGKRGTQDYKDAEVALLNDQLSLNKTVQDYIGKLKDSGLTQDEATKKLIKLGKELGLRKGEILDLANNALRTLNSQLDNTKTKLDALNDRKINIEIITHYTEVGKLA